MVVFDGGDLCLRICVGIRHWSRCLVQWLEIVQAHPQCTKKYKRINEFSNEVGEHDSHACKFLEGFEEIRMRCEVIFFLEDLERDCRLATTFAELSPQH